MTYFLVPLPGLSRVKSGRACHSAWPRSGRSSRKTSTGRFLVAHHPPAGVFYAPAQSVAPRFPELWAKSHPPLPNGLWPCGQQTGKLCPAEFAFGLGLYPAVLQLFPIFPKPPRIFRPQHTLRHLQHIPRRCSHPGKHRFAEIGGWQAEAVFPALLSSAVRCSDG